MPCDFNPVLFGLLVLRRRSELGLPQKELAARAFGDPSKTARISEIENGVLRVGSDKISIIMNELGIQEEDIPRISTEAPPERAKFLPGCWAGKATQNKGVSGHMELSVIFPKNMIYIHGSARFRILRQEEPEKILHVKFYGEMIHNDYLQLHYVNAMEGPKQFGSITARLGELADSLDGYFCGYGPVTKDLVYGEFTLGRSKPNVAISVA